ncbi:unnamed protein product [Notodromas monacha]|uniref:Ig-like domain-containing protein n=1 Tax=Notodromas monacha TaxID=399045 RepID=A0A7R9G8Z8_9CRUS|nr:unnamed protein product [Notodromas monacha]CAG0912319.1 unnamed protein product [Notodromas monacha]
MSNAATAGTVSTENKEPEFHESTPTNITAQLGSQVFLPCKVINLGDRSLVTPEVRLTRKVSREVLRSSRAGQEEIASRKSTTSRPVVRNYPHPSGSVNVVSWLRSRDQHILAVGDFKYVADDRFRAFYSTVTETWMLQIKYVKKMDAGSYECQLPTTPKKSHRLDVNVIVPHVQIVGGPEIYVKSDNRLNLRCRITKCIEPMELVEWYKDTRRISVTSNRLRIVYDKQLSEDGSATSTLEISKAVKSDSGVYSCKPSHLESSNVTVTVVNVPAFPPRGTKCSPYQDLDEGRVKGRVNSASGRGIVANPDRQGFIFRYRSSGKESTLSEIVFQGTLQRVPRKNVLVTILRDPVCREDGDFQR